MNTVRLIKVQQMIGEDWRVYEAWGSFTQRIIVSAEMEVRKPLVRSLESHHIDYIVCANLLQAGQVLSQQSFDVVFCDDRLPDGSYSDLVHCNHTHRKTARAVVTTRTGDWDLYFEAMERGAFDVIQSPCYALDVDATLK
jgi:DNA-binding NtrC family response regulator